MPAIRSLPTMRGFFAQRSGLMWKTPMIASSALPVLLSGARSGPAIDAGIS